MSMISNKLLIISLIITKHKKLFLVDDGGNVFFV